LENRRVVITGTDVVAPNGMGIDAFWHSLAHGQSGIRKITRFDASTYPCQVVAEVQDFDPTDYIQPKEVDLNKTPGSEPGLHRNPPGQLFDLSPGLMHRR
jgi:3-oxoacyl-(acyl-carrier-protein) synthase